MELGGTGGVVSLNYEYMFVKHHNWALNGGIGFDKQRTSLYFTIPVGISRLFALKRDSTSFLQAGIGMTYFKNNEVDFYRLTPSFGYRRNEKNGCFWRISANMFIGDGVFVPWIGGAFGYRFAQKPNKGL